MQCRSAAQRAARSARPSVAKPAGAAPCAGFQRCTRPHRLHGVAGLCVAMVLALDQIGHAVAVDIGEMDGATGAGQGRRRRRGAERKRPANAGVVHLERVIRLGQEHEPIGPGAINIME